MRHIAIIRFYLILAIAGQMVRAQDLSLPDTTNLRPLIHTSLEEDLVAYPLKVPDTSSPRATLQSFLDNVNRSYRVLMAADEINTNTPGLRTPDTVKILAKHAEKLLDRGVQCLNLSGIPADIHWVLACFGGVDIHPYGTAENLELVNSGWPVNVSRNKVRPPALAFQLLG